MKMVWFKMCLCSFLGFGLLGAAWALIDKGWNINLVSALSFFSGVLVCLAFVYASKTKK